MKKRTLALLCAALLVTPVAAEDTRQLVQMHPEARENLRQEMLDHLLALNEIIALLAAGQVKEAGVVAEDRLGTSAMGKHADKPMHARPGRQMPRAMHELGMAGHLAATEFANAAATGDRDKALALLPGLVGSCVACHFSYRTR